jgi:ABC-type sugar transport system substrate-binding protein
MPKRILVSLITGDNCYQKEQAAAARRAVIGSGLSVDIVYSEGLAQQQVADIYSRCLRVDDRERPDALVIETVSGDGLPGLAEKVVTRGVGWVLVNRRVDYVKQLRTAHPAVPVFCVGTDQKAVGTIQARQLRRHLPPGNGCALLITGPPDTSAAIERKEGFLEDLAPQVAGGLRINEYMGNWTKDSGRQAFLSWMRMNRATRLVPNGIVCQNDDMASGAIEAIGTLEDQQWRRALETVPCFGCDGGTLGLEMVKLRQLTGTVTVPTNTDEAINRLRSYWDASLVPVAEYLLQPTAYPQA